MCVEYGGWQICGMWCLTKNCCTSWVECSGVPWDKLHWHLYHAQISLKPPSKKEMSRACVIFQLVNLQFSLTTSHTSAITSPHSVWQRMSSVLITFYEYASIFQAAEPLKTWVWIAASLEKQFHHVIRFGSCFLEFCTKSDIRATLHILGHRRYDV
jgi:hypothetical protein